MIEATSGGMPAPARFLGVGVIYFVDLRIIYWYTLGMLALTQTTGYAILALSCLDGC